MCAGMHGICHADTIELRLHELQRIRCPNRLDEQEATCLLQHLENGDEDWGDDRLEALVYQQMHDFSTVDHGGVQVTQSEDTSFPEPIQKEAPAAAEHYFWCMLGARGGTWLAAVRPCAIPIAPKQGAPTTFKQRTTPTPSRQSPSRPRLRPRKRQRSSTHRRSPPGTEMLPEKIRGSMQGLLERNWVEFSHHFPSGEVLDAKTIEVNHFNRLRIQHLSDPGGELEAATHCYRLRFRFTTICLGLEIVGQRLPSL